LKVPKEKVLGSCSYGRRAKAQIQEICRQLGLLVVHIVRMRIGTYCFGNLELRQWRHLTTKEVEELKQPVK